MSSNYDQWKTTTPTDRAHEYECSCIECHEVHLQSRDFVEGCESCEMNKAERTARTGDPMDPWILEFKATAEGVTMFEGEREIGVIYYAKDAERVLEIFKNYPYLLKNVKELRNIFKEIAVHNPSPLSESQKKIYFETNYLLESMKTPTPEKIEP